VDRAQQRAKADAVVRGLVDAGIDAMVLGANDWALGTHFVRDLVSSQGAPVLASNLACDGERPFPATKVVERAGKKFGILGVTHGEVEGCIVGPVGDVLQRAAELLPDVDVRIALLPMDTSVSRRFLEDVSDVDLVVDTQSSRRGTSEEIGGAWMLGSGPRGQRVGLAHLTWRESGEGWAVAGHGERLDVRIGQAERRLAALQKRSDQRKGAVAEGAVELLEKASSELERRREERSAWSQRLASANLVSLEIIELDDTLADDPTAAGFVAVAQAAIESGAVGEVARVAAQRVVPDGAFIGSDVCAGCHPGPTAQWSGTAHAHAWQTLVDDGRSADTECFACHATGVGHPDGPTKPANVAGLRDVQCEACHGPARAHVMAPNEVKPVRSPDLAVCTGCHDGERDMGRFDHVSYLPKVTHTQAVP
jgi:hypothetical protein